MQLTDVSNDPFVQSEVQLVVEKLKDAYDRLLEEMKKPNILLIGKTGVGKSSLINSIFGKQFASVGHGQPVTKHLERYAPDDRPVIIYDTKGLEHGEHNEFISETSQYLMRLLVGKKDIKEHLHVAWYVIDLSQSRFQPFEADICASLLKNIPLFFLLNKCDSADRSQIDSIRNLLSSYNFPNNRGVYEIIADRKNFNFESCPTCGSSEFRFRQKTREIICENQACGVKTLVESTTGLEKLLSDTAAQLPALARTFFVNSLESGERMRLRMAKDTILECACAADSNSSGSSGADHCVHMATRLSLLWDWHLFPSVVSHEMALHYYNRFLSQSVLKRMSLAISNALRARRFSEALVVATGVEICRMLSEIRKRALQHALGPTKAGEVMVVQEEQALTRVEITEEALILVSQSISCIGLENSIQKLLQGRVKSNLVWSTSDSLVAVSSSSSSSSSANMSSSSPSASRKSSGTVIPPNVDVHSRVEAASAGDVDLSLLLTSAPRRQTSETSLRPFFSH